LNSPKPQYEMDSTEMDKELLLHVNRQICSLKEGGWIKNGVSGWDNCESRRIATSPRYTGLPIWKCLLRNRLLSGSILWSEVAFLTWAKSTLESTPRASLIFPMCWLIGNQFNGCGF
jgi:hypothetical protein